jgi:hypothetical protein
MLSEITTILALASTAVMIVMARALGRRMTACVQAHRAQLQADIQAVKAAEQTVRAAFLEMIAQEGRVMRAMADHVQSQMTPASGADDAECMQAKMWSERLSVLLIALTTNAGGRITLPLEAFLRASNQSGNIAVEINQEAGFVEVVCVAEGEPSCSTRFH